MLLVSRYFRIVQYFLEQLQRLGKIFLEQRLGKISIGLQVADPTTSQDSVRTVLFEKFERVPGFTRRAAGQ